ncbi:MAG: PD40 domain-containing protein [Anaerolineaceae bacterium]|nr:PD40 domain-containing protein [Anaerolineaceae bacterium]
MLVRTYRIADKFGIVILKSSAALTQALLDGSHIVVSAFRRGAFGTAGGVFAVLALVIRSIIAVIRRVALIIWAVLQGVSGFILRIINAISAVTMRGTSRVSGRVVQSAGSTAGGIMARRAARAEMETGLAEDPLRVQNRLLSIISVALLAGLIGVVLWATNPTNVSEQPFPPVNGGGAINLFEDTTATPAGAAPLLASPVPTVTPLPVVLEARGTLAYVAREQAQTDIWAIGIGSRTPIRLTNDPADDRDPAWSPDGRKLAYASRRSGNWDIYVYDTVTGSTTQMTVDLGYQGAPQWSPDGLWLVYESYQGNNLDIYVMPVDFSQQPQRVTDNAAPDFSPSWSPDGRRIAFVSWRDGNQDIYLFTLDDPRDSAAVNVTNTPTRQEDYPAWNPDGDLLAYSALDEGLEKVFVKEVDNPAAPALVLSRGRQPSWSPNGASLVAVVDSLDSTQLIAEPFAESGVSTAIVQVLRGSSDPVWTGTPLPAALVNSGGLGPAVTEPLYIEQVSPPNAEGLYGLVSLPGVEVEGPYLNDKVNDSFDALRERTLAAAGWDFLGQLGDAWWDIDRPQQPGEERLNWHKTGRAFAINRNLIVGFPAPIEVVRDDIGVDSYWRVYVRVADSEQAGQLGEPLRRMPWDFVSRSQGDVEAYDQGGRLKNEVPTGYYIDFTQLAQDYGWLRVAAGVDWRANINAVNYWLFIKPEGESWLTAMLELYQESQLGGYAPTAVPGSGTG